MTTQKQTVERITGVLIDFVIEGSTEKLPVFTPRPDTIYGATCIFIHRTNVSTTTEYAIHPYTQRKLPIYIANHPLLQNQITAVLGVPAHDEFAYDFAKQHDLPIIRVVLPPPVDTSFRTPMDIAAGAKGELYIEYDCWTGDGTLIHSDRFTGLSVQEAQKAITQELGGHWITVGKSLDT